MLFCATQRRKKHVLTASRESNAFLFSVFFCLTRRKNTCCRACMIIFFISQKQNEFLHRKCNNIFECCSLPIGILFIYPYGTTSLRVFVSVD